MSKNAEPKTTEPDATEVLNDHARALFAIAPPPLNDVLPEIVQQLGVQPWQFVIGHWLKSDQRAELHAPLLMDEWSLDSPAPRGAKGSVCEACGRIMTRDPNARFCCNFCGSGRYTRDQQHHADCEFYVVPKRYASLPGKTHLLGTPPADPQERIAWEEAQFAKRQSESLAAENAAGGLPPLPEDMVTRDARDAWAKR